MKKILILFCFGLLIGCVSQRFTPVYRQAVTLDLLDSVATAENWILPTYTEWPSSVYMAVADGDTTIVRVYNLWKEKDKQLFIFSVTTAKDSVIQVNFRKE